ncbi:MAG: hypothetical protein E6R08_06255 [Nevskiaceae bacterium]|nr:MAG: hypothetical protein E6R08_06255 [Nevskiaceae bacterium]
MNPESLKWFTDHKRLRVVTPPDLDRRHVLADFIYTQPRTSTVVIVAKRADFKGWAEQMTAHARRTPDTIHLITPDGLRNDCGMLGYIHTLIIDETLSGPASWRSVRIAAKQAERVIALNCEVSDFFQAVGEHKNAVFLPVGPTGFALSSK